ncbi:MAG: DNA mismatch repair endonuclease MutL [Chloroflexi bacterium]|nr:MAG: DNA mismatch repair endonuclease MutL [Chloroflexota bacterium]
MAIRQLPEEIAARIAAGEVVERPASVIKELVENSLDAGATRVEVETRGGGQTLLRVRDNGTGILSAEVPVAFRRHATSKLATADDLFHIATLGFRGEALASIAAVSRLTCTTRSAEETAGTRLRIEGGTVISHSAIGRPPGTEMLVEDLFYNVPARRKYLSSERTERRHIDAFLTRYAIAYPGVAFQVTHNGREALHTSGNGSAREVLLDVYGLELGGSLLDIPPELTAGQAIQVRGFVGPTTVHRANRGYITLFINGRWVQDLRITYAIIQAYHTLLPVKRFPVAVVMVDLPPEDVDVNVHPAKTEVRFREADSVFRAVQRAVRATVISEAPIAADWRPPTATQPIPSLSATGVTAPTTRASLAGLHPARQSALPGTATPAASPSTATTSSAPADPSGAAKLPPLRVVGQVATMFIVAEGPEGLYLIDQHAAHERVLYEQLLSVWAEGRVPAQPLLEPVTVTLPPDEAARLEERLPLLASLGLEVELFGAGSFLVRALPAPLGQVSPQELLADIAAADLDRSPVREGLEALTVRRICKRAAVKAGQVLSREEMENLVHALEQTSNPRTCPHGRPTVLQIPVAQLAAQFERR